MNLLVARVIIFPIALTPGSPILVAGSESRIALLALISRGSRAARLFPASRCILLLASRAGIALLLFRAVWHFQYLHLDRKDRTAMGMTRP
jgi:hypothetical protein